MELIIKKMRADFEVVANANRESGEWSADDVREFNAAIKAAIDGKDTMAIALWARWLAELATGVVFFNMVVRTAEAGMRAKAAQAKAGGK